MASTRFDHDRGGDRAQTLTLEADARRRARSAARPAPARAVPPARVAEVRPLTDDAIEVTFAVPESSPTSSRTCRASTSRCATASSTARAAPVVLDLPAAACAAASRSRSSATWAGASRPGRTPSSPRATRIDVMSPQGTFTSEGSPRSTASTWSASPPARASRRSWRSRTPCSRAPRRALHARVHEPLDARRDVPRGARRPQGPLPARLALHHVLSREQRTAPLLSGRIDAEKLRRMLDRSSRRRPSTSGSCAARSSWCSCARDTLEPRGVPVEHVRYELFTTEADRAEPRTAVRSSSSAARRRSRSSSRSTDCRRPSRAR